jgi:hypothetical protein
MSGRKRLPRGQKPIGLMGLCEIMEEPYRASFLDDYPYEDLFDVHTSFWMDAEMWEYLDEVSRAEDVSKATIMRLALTEFMKNHPLR